MGRGHRPDNEFVAKEQIRRDRQQRPAPGVRSFWPEFRIIRQANTEPSYLTHDWGDTLNDLGHQNYAVGKALALGSVSITLVAATHMRAMLEKKYPQAYSNPERTAKLHTRMRREFKDFTRGAVRSAFDGQTAELEATHRLLSRSMLVDGFSNELADPFLDDETAVSSVSSSVSSLALAEVLPLASGHLPYEAAEFTVNRLTVYGRGWGLDLSAHEQLYRERSDILRYLREDEQLNTSMIEKDGWEAHATVFNLSGHIASAPVSRTLDMPSSILFDAVRSDC